jgi:hypothetical protein
LPDLDLLRSDVTLSFPAHLFLKMNYTIEDLQKLKEVYLCGFEDDNDESYGRLSELARFEIEPFLEWLEEIKEETFLLIERYNSGEFRYEFPEEYYYLEDDED